MRKTTALAVLKWGVLLTAVLFLVVGLLNREYREVLRKAVAICLECIGIG